MMESSYSVTYVGRKLSAVKWLPGFSADVQSSVRLLATGSYDGSPNKLQLWTVPSLSRAKGAAMPSPELRCTQEIESSITQIDALHGNRLLVSTSAGSVSLFYASSSLDNTMYNLDLQASWNNIHYFPTAKSCPCTTLAGSMDGERVVTGGEDGRLNAFSTASKTVLWTADTGSVINKVQFRDSNEFVSVNTLGQLQLWDTRQAGSESALTMRDDAPSDSDALIQLCDVCVHPDQPMKVATGGEDGVLSVWDLRHPTFPQSMTEAHTAEIWQIKFHPGHSDSNLFTAGEDGRLLHWNTNANKMSRRNPEFSMSEINNLAISSLLEHDSASLGINALDVEAELLVCGTDNQSLMVFAPIIS